MERRRIVEHHVYALQRGREGAGLEIVADGECRAWELGIPRLQFLDGGVGANEEAKVGVPGLEERVEYEVRVLYMIVNLQVRDTDANALYVYGLAGSTTV